MEIFIIIICVALNAFLAAYEMAFVSVARPELRSLAKAGNKAGQMLLEFQKRPERTLSIIQIGITLVGAIAAAVGGAGAAESIEPFFVKRFGMSEALAESLAVILVVLPITFVSVVIGELVPKTLALRNPMRIVLVGAKWLFFADRALAPLVSLFEWSTSKILKLVLSRTKTAVSMPQTIIEIDDLTPYHQQFVINMAQIERKKIKDIFLPWNRINFVRSTDKIEEVLSVVFTSGHTRLPVIDNGSVVGVLHTKEFMALRESGEQNWLSIVRPILQIQPTDSALPVLRTMQEKRSHMAIVFSPAGERLGIVTLEDILEEVVGDIFDEDDDSRVRRVYAARARSRSVQQQGK